MSVFRIPLLPLQCLDKILKQTHLVQTCGSLAKSIKNHSNAGCVICPGIVSAWR